MDLVLAALIMVVGVPLGAVGLTSWLPASRRARVVAAARARRAELALAPPWELLRFPEETLCHARGEIATVGEALLEAPLSGRPCLHYHVVAHFLRYSQPSLTLISEARGVEALVSDKAHAAVLSPKAVSLIAPYDHETTAIAILDAGEREKALLARHNLLRRDWSSTTRVIYREAVILPGERVSVTGAVIEEADPDAAAFEGYRLAAMTRLRFVATEVAPAFIRSDRT
jgi:hypothetical protein